jgi:hypothetical protein
MYFIQLVFFFFCLLITACEYWFFFSLQMTEANNRSYVGIDAIVRTCSRVYPDQLNPTQATSVIKYWCDKL